MGALLLASSHRCAACSENRCGSSACASGQSERRTSAKDFITLRPKTNNDQPGIARSSRKRPATFRGRCVPPTSVNFRRTRAKASGWREHSKIAPRNYRKMWLQSRSVCPEASAACCSRRPSIHRGQSRRLRRQPLELFTKREFRDEGHDIGAPALQMMRRQGRRRGTLQPSLPPSLPPIFPKPPLPPLQLRASGGASSLAALEEVDRGAAVPGLPENRPTKDSLGARTASLQFGRCSVFRREARAGNTESQETRGLEGAGGTSGQQGATPVIGC